jgi:phosphoribosylformylglycinamidine synthase subunit PurSL
LKYRAQEVGRLSMQFLHHGLPMPTRKAIVVQSPRKAPDPAKPLSTDALKHKLLAALANPNVASKHWIIRQYDHEVQGGTVIKPLVGPMQIGPSDAAVVRPKPGSRRGIALGCGLAPGIEDPYEMALASIDEAIRNVVAVGADPDRTAILDNFCWPSVDDPRTLGTLVRACEACRDAALAYGIPFISGKDSLHNQFTNRETGQVLRIPRTLLVSAIGVIEDVGRCVTMDLKSRTGGVVLIESRDPSDPAALGKTHRAVARAIRAAKVAACHDISDGGLAAAAAEMCIASGMGMICRQEFWETDAVFAETPGRYLLELADGLQSDSIRGEFESTTLVSDFAIVQQLPKLTITDPRQRILEIELDELTSAWRKTLDW